jgi:hypothetical protein
MLAAVEPLRPCAHCRRHVRANETTCAFCGGRLEKATIRYVGRLPRATRGALMTLGAVALTHCGSEVVVHDDPPDTTSVSSSSVSSNVSSSSGGGNVGGMGGDIGVDLYGAPSVGGSSQGGADMGGASQGGGVPLYGAAPLPEDDDSL